MASRIKSPGKSSSLSGKDSRSLKSLPARKAASIKGGKRTQVKDANDRYA
jgi:hypothetical protein